jgi:hypothetical protein
VLGQRAFFSFATLSDPSEHRPYNAWHQLDHRPENLALSGVAYGDRWVRNPVCAALAPTPEPLSAAQYLNMYWFRAPWQQSIEEWNELARRSTHWGRRYDLDIADRLFIGFFTPVKGYASRRVLVSEDALPFRPVRGVHVNMTRYTGPARQYQNVAAWTDRELIPSLMSLGGVAGAWTFVSDPSIAPPIGETIPDNVVLRMLYLDDFPAVVAPQLTQRATGRPDVHIAEVLFEGFFETITPWSWDWFDQ